MKRRVVVTGTGVVTPVGIGVDEYWRGLVNGVSGIDTITRFDATDYDCRIAGEVKGFDPFSFIEKKDARHMDRFSQFAVASAKMAMDESGLVFKGAGSNADPEKAGVVFATGIGGMETFTAQFRILYEKGPSRVSPFFIPMMICNMAAGNIAIMFGLKGPNSTVVTACASSANAIGEAFRIIQRGDAEVMVTGGSEAAIVPMAFAGFCSMKAMSTFNQEPSKAMRPFDLDRDGFVMGEGGGCMVLESLEHAEKRGATILAEIIGYGTTADAYHVTAPAPNGEGGARSMKRALEDAGLVPEDVDYINAHGTSTPANDVTETMAIKAVFGETAYRIPVSSTKSMIGHLLGAAGVVELITCVKAIIEQTIPPTINYENPDPGCDLDYVPNKARRAKVNVALSNSFGFGGQNATLVVKRYVP